MLHPSKGFGAHGPEHSGVSYRGASRSAKEMEQLQCYKYFLFAYNLLIFLCAAALIGVGIWMAVDRNFITYMVGSDLYAVAIYLILAAGIVIFAVSFLGCCGSVTENKCMLITFFLVLCVVFLLLLIGAVLAGVFRAQIGSAVQETMTDTLVNHYGVNLYSRQNRLITDAWDKAQERLQCCAVKREGWHVYRESEWYKRYGAFYDQTGLTSTSEDMKPYVPKSCCVKDRFWRLINSEVCQKWRIGPPGSPVDGAINRALYYEGCYDAALRYIKENANILIGLAITVAVLLGAGIYLAFILLRMLRGDKVEE